METLTIYPKSKNQDSILENFFVEEIKDLYGAEKQVQKNFRKLIEAANSSKLKKAFEDHNRVTIDQISRLEDIFKIVGRRPQAKKCEAMEGLVEEFKSVISETNANSATRDVALIMAAQKIEHYEIASYGGLRTLAKTLGLEKVTELLHETLGEEKDVDNLLSQIAENDINYQSVNKT
jgi:ferritin-like metal-binding protein YciE